MAADVPSSPPPQPHSARVAPLCLEYVREHATRGDAASVLKAIDTFGYEHWMMNVGDVKGAIVDAEIDKLKPKVMAEIGGYCGYSAVRFASRMLAVSGPSARYYSFEFSAEYAAIAREIIDIAGLSDVVTITVGAFSDTYTQAKGLGIEHVDVFFIDHKKDLYLSDLKLIETSGLLRQGSVVIADNVITPGAPDYLAYIRQHPQFSSVFHASTLEYSSDPDGIEVSTFLG